MTKEKKMEKYMNAIRRRLNLPPEVKNRVMNDLESSVVARREAGERDEEIMAELGNPKEVAASLNEQMKEYAYRKSPWRWAALAASGFGLLMLLFNGMSSFLAWLLTESVNKPESLGVIGGADGPTAIFVTTTSDPWAMIPWVIVAVMGAVGFWYLGHMKKE